MSATKTSPPPVDVSRADSPVDSKVDVKEDESSSARKSIANDPPDYFNSNHNGTNSFALEPNPFEQSFGNLSNNAETPGKSLLPPVAALASPALPGSASAGGFNWQNSLRSGPLSPAMLTGPTATNDYFDSIGRGITPNESGLRSGLTPGGSGSMFPSPSPGANTFLNLQSGGATPSTLEFQRTAFNAARKSGLGPAPTSNPPSSLQQSMSSQPPPLEVPKTAPAVDPFGHHDAADAANGLFMLAKGAQAHNQFPSQSQSQSVSVQNNEQPVDNNINMMPMDDLQPKDEVEDDSSEDDAIDTKAANGRNRRKRSSTSKRKTEDPRGSGSKKSKANNGSPVEMDDLQALPNSKKMTDEEKRKNFLERNRVAALKCRQRKKQWLTNLQNKCEVFRAENEVMTNTINHMREELVALKTAMLAHKDCPVTQAQGLGNLLSNPVIQPDYNATATQHQTPYGLPLQSNGMPVQGVHTANPKSRTTVL